MLRRAAVASTGYAPQPPRGWLQVLSAIADSPAFHVALRNRWLLCVRVVLTFALAMPVPALAQQGLSLNTKVSANTVEADDDFLVQLSATVQAGSGSPSNPHLKVPAGIVAHGPSVSSQQRMVWKNGRVDQQYGITATWTVSASKPGTYTLGPASVEVDGRRVADQRIRIRVLPKGQGTQRKRHRLGRSPFDPFDMFGRSPGMPGSGFFDHDSLLDELPDIPEEYQVQSASDSVAFLRATVEPKQVVIGEPVTLTLYAYGAQGQFKEGITSDPSRANFLQYKVIEDSRGQRMYRMGIDGELWYVQKVRQMVLIPVRAGDFEVGKMKFGFIGHRYPPGRGRGGLMRESEPVSIRVVEPPTEGRPAGYEIGHVGQYQLTAEVSPREIEAGGAVSVVATLQGRGNVPQSLRVPHKNGVEWSQPTITEQVEATERGLGGWRKFSYVVRVNETGVVDLGELRVPYWDHERETYRTATADLDTIRVAPSAGEPSPAISTRDDVLATLLTPRHKLGQLPDRAPPLSDQLWYWALLGGAPLSIVLAGGALAAGRRWSKRRSQQRSSISAQTQRALKDAKQANRAGDGHAAARATERALVLAIENATGVRARGLLREQLGSELQRRGIEAEAAEQAVQLLGMAEELRFTEPDPSRTAELIDAARLFVGRLGRTSRRSESDVNSAISGGNP